MLNHTDWMIHLERRKDLMREAEEERLARLALAGQTNRAGVWLHRISQWLAGRRRPQPACCEGCCAPVSA